MIKLLKKIISYILSIKIIINIKDNEPPELSEEIIDGDNIIENKEESIIEEQEDETESISNEIIQDLIEEDDDIKMNKIGTISTTALYVRTGPTVEYPILGCVLENDIVEIIGQNKLTKWYKIEYNDEFGYISNKYVSVVEIVSSNDDCKYGDGCEEINEVIDSHKCCFKFNHAVLTQYAGDEVGSYGKLIYDQHCASHNLPYGTLVYIPMLKGVVNQTGLFTVMDTGGHGMDFDIYTKKDIGKINADVYVVSWGKGPIAWSFTEAIEYYLKTGTVERYNSAWSLYNRMKGCTINCWLYKEDDKNIKLKSWYNADKIKKY